MKYKALPLTNGTWGVYETASKQFVACFHKENHARRTVKIYNRGIGWFGWTPSFFLIGMKVL